MRGDEIDAGIRPASIMLVKIARSRKPIANIGELSVVALPVASKSIAIFAVPLRPLHREVADLVAAFSHIPWLCDELYIRKGRVLVNDVEEAAQPVHIMQLARKRSRKIEAEAVDMHLCHPVAQ